MSKSKYGTIFFKLTESPTKICPLKKKTRPHLEMITHSSFTVLSHVTNATRKKNSFIAKILQLRI